MIVPNSTNAVGMTLKGIAGDTGIPLSLTQASVFSQPASPPANIVITSAAPGVTVTEIYFA
jgi:hypothetical protein